MKLHCIMATIIDEPEEYRLVAFKGENESYFNIQDAVSFDEQDILLKMDSYHLQLNNQRFSGYGGIENIVLTPNEISIKFNEHGRMNLRQDSLTIEFEEVISEELGSAIDEFKSKYDI